MTITHPYRPCDLSYTVHCYIANISVTMVAAFITTVQIKVFDQSTFSIITQLKKKHKRADINSIHSKIIKTFDFKDISKEYLQDRSNTLIINEKISNKKNRNFDS